MGGSFALVGPSVLQRSSVVLLFQSCFVSLKFLRFGEARVPSSFKLLLFGLLLFKGAFLVQLHATRLQYFAEEGLRLKGGTSTMGCTS